MEFSPLGLVFTAVLFLASLLALLARVRRATRLPVALAATVAVALLVSFDTLLLNLLSLVEGVTRFGVVAGHGLLLAALLRRPDAVLKELRLAGRAIHFRRLKLAALVLAPLAFLILLSVVRYAPNDFDAMTRGLARVAHWIQNRSVGPYPTGIPSQLFIAPGSDYLLLMLQVASGSDRLAGFLGFGCTLLAVFSGPSLARLAGAPARLAPLAALVVATLPLAVLHASSARTDPVAAVLAVALVAMCIPFLHAGHGPRRPAGAGFLLGVALAAASLTGPTALLASGPFVVLAVAASARRLIRGRGKSWLSLMPVLLAFATALVLVLPELRKRNLLARIPEMMAEFSYPPFFQLLFAVSALAVLFLRFARVSARARWAGAALIASGVLLLRGGSFSDSQLPLIALAPLILGAFRGIAPPHPRESRQGAVAAGLVVLSAVYAGAAAVRNDLRPPLGKSEEYELSYYNAFVTEQAPHAATLDLAVGLPCRRLGLLLRESSYDYPLTWRAMQAGIEVRHVTGPDPWPCLIYSDRGAPLPVPGRIEWVPLASTPPGQGGARPFLFSARAFLPRD